jgi:hypothetical protein
MDKRIAKTLEEVKKKLKNNEKIIIWNEGEEQEGRITIQEQLKENLKKGYGTDLRKILPKVDKEPKFRSRGDFLNGLSRYF